MTQSKHRATKSAPSTYRRSTGSARGESKRQELLERVADDLATTGLNDFSLRSAARAAGTTHKVLLYHFESADDLLTQAITLLRERRVANALDALGAMNSGATLSGRVKSIWQVLQRDDSGLRVLDQAIGLALVDPMRYHELAAGASEQYREPLLAICPDDWSARRKREVSQMILATLRGLLIDWLTTHKRANVDAGLKALMRALDREEECVGRP